MLNASRPVRQVAALKIEQPGTRERNPGAVTLADLCAAIAKGHLPVEVDDSGCYNVKRRAVKAYFQRLGRVIPDLMATPNRN